MTPSTDLRRASTSSALGALAIAGAALTLSGCNGAFIGNFVVLGITMGIFFGTLGLGRTTTPTMSRGADRSTDTQR